MTCPKCITLEAERDQYAQALARVNEEAIATERDRDRLREALRAMLFEFEFARNDDQTQHFYSTCEEGLAINAGGDCVLCTARAALEGEP